MPSSPGTRVRGAGPIGRAAILLAMTGLTLAGGGPAAAGPAGRPPGERLCFAVVLGPRLALDVTHRGARTLSVHGRVIPDATPPLTLPIQGSGRLRADGKLELVATAAIAAPLGFAAFLLSARLDPPAFESGFGFFQLLDGTPPQPALFVPDACPTAFPDVP